MGTPGLLGFYICDKDLDEMLDEREGKESMVEILSNEETREKGWEQNVYVLVEHTADHVLPNAVTTCQLQCLE